MTIGHLTHPPDDYKVPQNPVRDPDAVGPTEDLDREPDGVPHSVVGLTALFSTLLAMVLAFVFATGGLGGKIIAIAIALVAIPWLVGRLRAKADRERDRRHPSR